MSFTVKSYEKFSKGRLIAVRKPTHVFEEDDQTSHKYYCFDRVTFLRYYRSR